MMLGCGARTEINSDLLDFSELGWVEILSDNFVASDEDDWSQIDRFAGRYQLSFHSVGLSLGYHGKVDPVYLRRLKRLYDWYNPEVVSDHLCWNTIQAENHHDLLPVPFRKSLIPFVVDKIKYLQDYFGRHLAIENISYYLRSKDQEVSEWDFIQNVCEKSDCQLLLDVSNLHLNSLNWGYDPQDFLSNIDWTRVKQLHIAGYQECDGVYLDTHNKRVSQGSLGLLAEVKRRAAEVPVILEWDSDLPSRESLYSQLSEINGKIHVHSGERRSSLSPNP